VLVSWSERTIRRPFVTPYHRRLQDNSPKTEPLPVSVPIETRGFGQLNRSRFLYQSKLEVLGQWLSAYKIHECYSLGDFRLWPVLISCGHASAKIGIVGKPDVCASQVKIGIIQSDRFGGAIVLLLIHGAHNSSVGAPSQPTCKLSGY
jgi:hypothetical protein